MPLKLYNTLTRKKEIFKSLKGKVKFYACGPTVYQRAHVGNLRTYINEDILKRVLLLNGFKVRHVMNITDVGHLEHDLDTGEDKVEKEAREKRKSAWDIARQYEKVFKEDLKKLDILSPDIFPRATEHIEEQIRLIKKLESKGLAYKIADGIYFDTSKFKKYGVLVREKLKGIKAGARVSAGDKRNATDFALWKFSPKDGVRRQMEWSSPWGVGFPGWHVECSAMSVKYLGMPVDIHAGGIDHIHPHHTNEIAQSEAAFGKKFVRLWMHSEFLKIGSKRMGKSEGNAMTLDELLKKNIRPLDFRYFTLNARYRAPMSFTMDALKAASRARGKLKERLRKSLEEKSQLGKISFQARKKLEIFKKTFLRIINDDLDAPQALGFLWKTLNASDALLRPLIPEVILFADHVFGLGLADVSVLKVADDIQNLLEKREAFRSEKKWKEADQVREKIGALGYSIEDTARGPKLRKNT